MCYFRKIHLLFSLLSFFIYFGVAQEKAASFNVYAIANVNVIPMDREQVLENHTVIIEDDRITDVAPSEEVKYRENAEEIDGRELYLIPGLTEMHGHIPGEDQPQYVEDVLFLYIANGVTTVRNMLGNAYNRRPAVHTS